MEVLILTGPLGVGKTTVAGLLAQRADRSAHLEADLRLAGGDIAL